MYLLDANVFIEAKNRYFGFDICPGFWDWLKEQHAAGTVFSIRQVSDELLPSSEKIANPDDLSDWVRTLPKSFFLSADDMTTPHFVTLTRWANDPQQQFTQGAKAEFFSVADYFLAAQAKALGYTVVTNERPDAQSKKRIKLPNACQALGVPFMSPIEFMRSEGLRLIRALT